MSTKHYTIRKLTNIRYNHIHQATNKIIKLHPYRVVMKNLNTSSTLKNKHLSKYIANQYFYEFIKQIKYKCKKNSEQKLQRYLPTLA